MTTGNAYLYRRWLTGAVERFAAEVRSGDPSAPVGACPGWDVADVVGHLVAVHRWVAEIVSTGQPAASPDAERPGADPVVLERSYRASAVAMQDAMDRAEPDAPCWNFSGVNPTQRFWPRRQVHEITVHTVDVAAACGREVTIDPDVAADGVHEVITVFATRMAARRHPATLERPLAIVPTDHTGAWTLSPPDAVGGPPHVSPGISEEATASLSATASDLLLVMWKRLPADHVRIEGDAAVATAYLASRLVP